MCLIFSEYLLQIDKDMSKKKYSLLKNYDYENERSKSKACVQLDYR